MPELTIDQLENIIPPGKIFACGYVQDGTEDFNMHNGAIPVLRWIAKTGYIGDWAIYIHRPQYTLDFIERHGDKVGRERNIRHLVSCTDEAFKRYRY